MIPYPVNLFWISGKVPSMNELLYAKQATGQSKRWLTSKVTKPNTFVWNKYNDIKKEWTNNTVKCVSGQGFEKVKSGYFHYLVIEQNFKRDPSNISFSAIKFIEDGMVKAGVIPNDGHKQILGILPHWRVLTLFPHGVFVWISNRLYDSTVLESITIDSEITLKRFGLLNV